MEAYTDFATVYDTFMDDTPYTEWCEFIHGLLKKYKIETGIIADLGCGTGTLTQKLAQKGYDMIGIDYSQEMLNIAMEKKAKDPNNILYLHQDMRELELFGTVAAMISVCDSINYLLEEEDLTETFRKVNNYLDPQGLFLFDFNTDYKYREIIGDTVIAENREGCSFIWENYYDEEEQLNEYDITIFIQETQSDLYRKFEETHFQKGYTLEIIKSCLKSAGMIFVEAIDADTHKAVTQKSERIYVVAKENIPGKHGA